jgi:hypothetical protein
MNTFLTWIVAVFDSIDKARVCTGLARQGGQQAKIKRIMLG